MCVHLCMPAFAPAGFPVHKYASVCGLVFCVRVRAHTSLRLWRDKEERLSQRTGGIK